MTAGFLTTDEAARALGYHVAHVYRLLRSGKLKGRKVGGKVWLIDVAEVERIKAMQNDKGRLPRSDRG